MEHHAGHRQNKNERNESSGFVFHKGTVSSGQRDCDRGSIRVFEERMASEPNGDWLSGTRDAQKSFSEFIIQTAKENNLYIPEEQITTLGERKRLPSGESIIYENASQGIVYKVRDPFAKFYLKSDRVVDVLYDHVAHNLLFPEANYRLIGITSQLEDVRFVLAQQFFYVQNIPTQQQINSYLSDMGLSAEDRYYYGNEYIAVTDVDAASDNVLLDDNGRLLFIDPIIKMKKPIDDIIRAYPFDGEEQSAPSKRSFMSFIKDLLHC